jgi:hypothetical protein
MEDRRPIPEEAWAPDCNFVVRFEIEVRAATPEQAAVLARDRMLDPDAPMSMDILPMVEIAGDLFSVDDEGWQARFSKGVKPVELIAWRAEKL